MSAAYAYALAATRLNDRILSAEFLQLELIIYFGYGILSSCIMSSVFNIFRNSIFKESIFTNH